MDRLRPSAVEQVTRAAEWTVRGLREQVLGCPEALLTEAACQFPASATDHAKQEALETVLEPRVDRPDNELSHPTSILLVAVVQQRRNLSASAEPVLVPPCACKPCDGSRRKRPRP